MILGPNWALLGTPMGWLMVSYASGLAAFQLKAVFKPHDFGPARLLAWPLQLKVELRLDFNRDRFGSDRSPACPVWLDFEFEEPFKKDAFGFGGVS